MITCNILMFDMREALWAVVVEDGEPRYYRGREVIAWALRQVFGHAEMA